MTFVYDCVYVVTGTRNHFTLSLRCLPTPVPPFDQAHSTSTILPLLMLHHLDGNLSAALINCSTTRTHSSAALLYVLARTLYTSFVYTVVTVMFYCSLLLLLDM